MARRGLYFDDFSRFFAENYFFEIFEGVDKVALRTVSLVILHGASIGAGLRGVRGVSPSKMIAS